MMRTSKLKFDASFGESEAIQAESISVCIEDPREHSLEHAEERLGIGGDLNNFDLGGLEPGTRNLEAQILYRQLLLDDVIHRTSNTLQVAISAFDAQIGVAYNQVGLQRVVVLRLPLVHANVCREPSLERPSAQNRVRHGG